MKRVQGIEMFEINSFFLYRSIHIGVHINRSNDGFGDSNELDGNSSNEHQRAGATQTNLRYYESHPNRFVNVVQMGKM